MPPKRRSTRNSLRKSEELDVAETIAGLAQCVSHSHLLGSRPENDRLNHNFAPLQSQSHQNAIDLPKVVVDQINEENQSVISHGGDSKTPVEEGRTLRGQKNQSSNGVRASRATKSKNAGKDNSSSKSQISCLAPESLSINSGQDGPLAFDAVSANSRVEERPAVSCVDNVLPPVTMRSGIEVSSVATTPVILSQPPTGVDNDTSNVHIWKLPLVVTPMMMPDGSVQLVTVPNGMQQLSLDQGNGVDATNMLNIISLLHDVAGISQSGVDGQITISHTPNVEYVSSAPSDDDGGATATQRLLGSLSTLRDYYKQPESAPDMVTISSTYPDINSHSPVSSVSQPALTNAAYHVDGTLLGTNLPLANTSSGTGVLTFLTSLAADCKRSSADNVAQSGDQTEGKSIDTTSNISRSVPGSLSTLRNYYSSLSRNTVQKTEGSAGTSNVTSILSSNNSSSQSEVAEHQLSLMSASVFDGSANTSVVGRLVVCTPNCDGGTSSVSCTRVLPEIPTRRPVSNPIPLHVERSDVENPKTELDVAAAGIDAVSSHHIPAKKRRVSNDSGNEEAGKDEANEGEKMNYSSEDGRNSLDVGEGKNSDSGPEQQMRMTTNSGVVSEAVSDAALPTVIYVVNSGDTNQAEHNGNHSTVEGILSQMEICGGSQQSTVHPLLIPDEDGDLPLHVAVVRGELELVKRLLTSMAQLNASVDCFNNSRQTPLHLAVITENTEIVVSLLGANSSPNTPDRHGFNSLHLAVNRGHADCLTALLYYSHVPVNIDAKNYEGVTPLHLAVKLDRYNLAETLLDAGADVDAVDGKNGHTPLHLAAEMNRTRIGELLLKRNASVQYTSYYGCTAMQAASARGHHDMVKLLAKYGASSEPASTDKPRRDSRDSSESKSKGKSPKNDRRPSSNAAAARQLSAVV